MLYIRTVKAALGLTQSDKQTLSMVSLEERLKMRGEDGSLTKVALRADSGASRIHHN